MRICLVLEGCYPYVHGGVSTWMHGYITAMPEHEFVLWVIGAHAADRGKFVYELPGNVVEVHEVFLDDALRLSGEQHEASFNNREREALRRLVSLSNPDWDVLFDIFHRRRVHPLSFLQSRTFMDIFRDVCLVEYPYIPFSATSFPSEVMMYSFFLPSQSPQGLIHSFSCKEFNAPYKVPAPNESRPPVFSSINCMTAYPCFGV